MKPKILIVDDQIDELETMLDVLSNEDYELIGSSTAAEAESIIEKGKIDLLLVDLVLPGPISGLDLLAKCKKLTPPPECILITGHATIETAIKAMKGGAYDYLVKPVDIERLRALVAKALEKRLLAKKLSEFVDEEWGFENMVGKSPCMQKVFDIIKMVARTPSTVLITGESGTGKELVANAIHNLSPRRYKPLYKINCSAIPESLIEAELFGYEKGAFTGASSTTPGKLELADGGTVFLDEIGDFPVHLQPKLLRVLEDGEFERVGGRTKIKVDLRFISASNRNLEKMVQEGTFRADLFFRLRVVTINVPPLRERKEDIPLLINYFIKKTAERMEKKVTGIAPELLEMFKSYDWPGNVRELKNAIEELIALSKGEILEDPPTFLRTPEKTESETLSISELEAEAIRKALKKFGGDKVKAAQSLGISLRTLYRRLKELQIK